MSTASLSRVPRNRCGNSRSPRARSPSGRGRPRRPARRGSTGAGNRTPHTRRPSCRSPGTSGATVRGPAHRQALQASRPSRSSTSALIRSSSRAGRSRPRGRTMRLAVVSPPARQRVRAGRPRAPRRARLRARARGPRDPGQRQLGLARREEQPEQHQQQDEVQDLAQPVEGEPDALQDGPERGAASRLSFRAFPRCAPTCRNGRAGNRAWRAAPAAALDLDVRDRGLCVWKTRSTPSPCDTLRTVNESLRPRLRHAITTPS